MKSRFLLVLATVCMAVPAHATYYTWVGGSSGDWNVALNWTSEGGPGVPGGGDTAAINESVAIRDGIAVTSGELWICYKGKLDLYGVISGAGKLHCESQAADEQGYAEVHLYGANTISGGLEIRGKSNFPVTKQYQGDVHVHHGSALGVGTAEITCATGPRLYIDGGLTIETPIWVKSNQDADTGVVYLGPGGGVVFNKSFTARYKLYLHGAGVGVSYLFKDRFETNDYTWFYDGDFTFEETAAIKTLYNEQSATLHFLGDVPIPYFCIRGETYLDADYSLTTEHFSFDKFVFLHLNGHPQKIVQSSTSWNVLKQSIGVPDGYLTTFDYGFESPRSAPALMTFALANGTATTETWTGRLVGGAGLCWNPVNPEDRFILSKTLQATSGDLLVSNGIVRVTDGAGFLQLNRLAIADGASVEIDTTASCVRSRHLEIAAGGKLDISGDRTGECETAAFGGVAVPAGTYTKADYPDYIGNEGTLVVGSRVESVWTGGAEGNWTDAANWSHGTVPVDGESVAIESEARVSLTASTAKLSSLELSGGGTLVTRGWWTSVLADEILIGAGGVITTSGAFSDGDAGGVSLPSSRVLISCTDLTIATGGKIDVDAKGWLPNKGPASTFSSVYGASHGGYGAMKLVNASVSDLYDNPLNPLYPGTGSGTAGGGAVMIEAKGDVRVDGAILASGGSQTTEGWSGSGGSVQIKCATFSGDGGVVRAEGGAAGGGVFPAFVWQYRGETDTANRACAGAGGMIRITYGSAQSSSSPVNVAVSAGAGIHLGLTPANHDKFRTDADLGTLTFSDDVLLRQLIGKGLSGRLVGVSSFTYDGDLNWTAGHLRFPGTETVGADVRINGNLVLNGTSSRLEVGGLESSRYRNVTKDIYAGTNLNRIVVTGDVRLLTGSALDIRAAATNGQNRAWGGEVSIGGDFEIGSESFFYPWCDCMNLGAPHVSVGGDFTVAAGGTVSADRRGGMGGRGGENWKNHFGLSSSAEAGFGAGAARTRGAAHGGAGGVGWQEKDGTGKMSGWAGAIVDDEWTADFPGAGGGAEGYAEGGQGGGLVSVDVGGRAVVDGTVSADGWIDTSYVNLGSATTAEAMGSLFALFGSGAGGGIRIACSTFSGCGRLQARGGDAISGYVNGTGGNDGHVFGYASAAGGGGRIVIRSGCDLGNDPDRVREVRAVSQEDSSFRRIRPTNDFSGTCDVSGGKGVWNAIDQTGTAPQFTYALGSPGTVRFVGYVPIYGLMLIVR